MSSPLNFSDPGHYRFFQKFFYPASTRTASSPAGARWKQMALECGRGGRTALLVADPRELTFAMVPASHLKSSRLSLMADEFIISNVKEAIHLARQGKHDESFARYQSLFDAPQFASAPVDNRRQALKLMVTAKGIPEPLSAAAVIAFQSAWQAIAALVQNGQEPQDYDLLGLTHLRLGDSTGAKQVFEAGLAVAHRNNDAEWSGLLLKRISSL
jgi:hypothetical protein